MELSVTAADLAAALDDVPAQARRLAERREVIERQHADWADLKMRAIRVSVSGVCFDLGGGNIVRWESMNNGPTPRGSSVLFMAYLIPTRIARQLEDAQATGKPIVLQEGARIRHIDIEGRITPNDYDPPIVRLTGWALALGAAIGSAASLLLMAVLS